MKEYSRGSIPKFIVYILAYGILWLLARLPLRALYLISDLLFLVVFHVVGYRKKVVYRNLAMAFPEYSGERIRSTARKFYHHFVDVMLESAVLPFISYKRASRRFSFRNTGVIEDLYEKKKMIIGIGAHYGNWEFLTFIQKRFRYQFVAIYKPLRNKYFDNLIRRSRSRYGSIPVAMNRIARLLMELKKDNILAFSGFLTDQRPIWQHIQYWTKFMGIDTPVYLGPEKLAVKLDAAVVYLAIRKIKRGTYEIGFELISETARSEAPYAITEAHVRLLEKLIREEPPYWLWSHNRWKYDYEDFKQKHPNYQAAASED